MKSNARYFLSLLALAMGGSSIWLLQYIRYVFYDPMLQTLGCTNAQLGALTTISTVMGWIMILPNGIMADKFDSKKLIVFAMILNSCASFFFATTMSYKTAIVTWALLSFSVGLGYWPSLIKFINSLAGPEQAGKSFSYYYAIYGIFAACVSMAEVAVGNMVGFRGTVLVIGITTLACGIIDIFVLENDDKRYLRNLGEMYANEIGAEVEEAKPEKHKMAPSDLWTMVKWPGFWLFGLSNLFAYTIYAQISYYNPFLINVMGLDSGLSSTFSLVRTYLFMLWCPLGGILADKVFHATWKAFVVLYIISGILLGITLVFHEGGNAMVAAVYSLIPAIFIMPLYSINNACLREMHINPALLGTTIAVASQFGSPVDGVWPVLFGHWIDVYGNGGFNYIFLFLTADCVLGVLMALAMGRHHKKCQEMKRVQLVKGQEAPETCEW